MKKHKKLAADDWSTLVEQVNKARAKAGIEVTVTPIRPHCKKPKNRIGT